MGKIGDIYCNVRNEKAVYRAGDEIKGHWEVNVTGSEAVSADYIILELNGEGYVYWDEADPNPHGSRLKFRAREYYTNQKTYVWKDSLEPGQTIMEFSFKFPDDKIPSSMESRYGCVRYWLNLTIKRPGLRFNVKRFKALAFLDKVDTNTSYFNRSESRSKTEKMSKFLGIGDAGTISMKASINRRGFCPGEQIAIDFTAENNSTKDVGIIRAALIQTVKCRANGDEKLDESYICGIRGSQKLVKGEKLTWTKSLLRISAIPPSTRIRASHIVVVEYHIEFTVDVPKVKGGDVKMWIKVEIGTTPQGYIENRGPSPGLVSEIDLRNCLTYTKCNAGWRDLELNTCDTYIPNWTYTPMCVYVPNYQYVKPKTAASTRVATTTTKSEAAPKPVAATAKTVAATIKASTTTQKAGVATTHKIQTKATSTNTSTTSTTQVPTYNSTSNEKQGQQPPPPSYTAATASKTDQMTMPVSSNVQQNTTGSISDQVNKSEITSSFQSPETTTPVASHTLNAERLPCIDREKAETNDVMFSDMPGENDNIMDDESIVTNKNFLLIRFPASKLAAFKSAMIENTKSLRKFEGKLVALEAKNLNAKGQWPKEKILAVLAFSSEELSSKWLSVVPGASDSSWLHNSDILIVKGIESAQSGHGALIVSLKNKNDVEQSVFDTYRALVAEHFNPVMILAGACKMTGIDAEWRVSQGNWGLSNKSIVIMSSWPTVKSLTDFRKSFEKDLYDEFLRMQEEVYSPVGYAVLKLDTLAFLQEDEGQEKDGQ